VNLDSYIGIHGPELRGDWDFDILRHLFENLFSIELDNTVGTQDIILEYCYGKEEQIYSMYEDEQIIFSNK
jgi:hypothetical protein